MSHRSTSSFAARRRLGRCVGARSRRRAFVLLAMLVAIGAAMVVTSAVVWTARSEHAGRTASLAGIRRRAAAWSAAQAIASELGAQRTLALSGGTPTLPLQLHLYDDGAEVAVARFIPAAADGRMLLAEAGLADVNGIEPDALEALGFDEAVVDLVVTARGAAGGELGALEAIADRAGVSPELLRGEQAFDAQSMAILRGLQGGERGRALANAGSSLDDAGARLERAGSALARSESDSDGDGDGAGSGAGNGAGAGSDAASAPIGAKGTALADRLTVFAVEPAISRRGEARVELGAEWTDHFRDRFGTRLDESQRRRLDGMARDGAALESDGDLVRALIAFGIEPDAWGELLDEVTAERGAWRWGRIDLNHAEPAVLGTIPELSSEQVARLVRTREALDSTERANIAWPVLRGIVEPEAFAELLPRITTRSLFWRVRFVAGFSSEDDVDGPLSGVTLWECVVDLTGERPRIAALRDLSLAPTLARLLEERPMQGPSDEEEGSLAADAATEALDAIDAMLGDPDAAPGSGDPPDAGAARAEAPPFASHAKVDATVDDAPEDAASEAADATAGAAASHAAPPPVGRFRPRGGRASGAVPPAAGSAVAP